KVPTEQSIEAAQEAARLAVLNRLAVVRDELGTLDHVSRIISLQGFVNSEPDFHDPPVVINGASNLLVEIFGERGKHSRIAVGVTALPANATVE
ncbi:MAG: RidA family protein, partial [Akkermansiaceae bacterium]|nr:RidA family protein [Akkermansiaceae bacterium]